MTKLLEQAMAKVATLPAKTQEKIGEELLAHVEKVHALRGALEMGISARVSGRSAIRCSARRAMIWSRGCVPCPCDHTSSSIEPRRGSSKWFASCMNG